MIMIVKSAAAAAAAATASTTTVSALITRNRSSTAAILSLRKIGGCSSSSSSSSRVPRRENCLRRGMVSSSSSSSFSSITSSTLWKEAAFINGDWITVDDTNHKESFDVLDPSTDSTVIATLPDMSTEETETAIGAAHRTYLGENTSKNGGSSPTIWRDLLAKERAAILRDLFLLHKDYENELGEILALESGKPIGEAIGEIRYGAGFFDWYSEEAKRLDGSIIPEPVAGRKVLAMKEPVGVCGLVTPWNFPNAMIARKLGPVLATGCTAVIKPSQDTPMSTLAIVALLQDKIGLPPGVVNVVTAGSAKTPSVGTALCVDDRVRKISFTGSTRVGQQLMKQSADSVKKISMELGGDAPFIVFDDADLSVALDAFMISKFRNAGQTCVSTNRVYVHSSVHDKFVEMVTDRINSELKVGRYNEEGVNMGPLINPQAIDKVDGIVQDDVKSGAKVMTGGGKGVDYGPDGGGGNFYQPTVLANCDDTMRCAKEEIFGPVATIFKFETEEEVIDRANNTTAGLAAYYFTKDMSRTFRVGKKLQYGMVGCNTGFMSDVVVPFGGIKHSGLGREGSKLGIDDYVHVKTLTLQHD